MRKVVTSFLPGLALFAIVVAALRIGFEPMPAQAQQPPATGGCLVINTATGAATNNCAFILQGYTVAGLPSCTAPKLGMQAYVTDALTPTYNGALTGGSTTKVPVFCNGAAWTSH